MGWKCRSQLKSKRESTGGKGVKGDKSWGDIGKPLSGTNWGGKKENTLNAHRSKITGKGKPWRILKGSGTEP